MGEKCTNCGESFRVGEAIKPDGNGGHRHPSKCGRELDGLKPRRTDWCTLQPK